MRGAILLVILWLVLFPSHATAGDIVNFRAAHRLAAVASINGVTTHSPKRVRVLMCTVTAYSPSVFECDGDPMTTASGKRVSVGGIAADLDVLPFGSIVIIPNYNNGKPCIVTDTGSAIKGNKLDVFMWSADAAVHWGRRRNVKVQVLYVPKAKS